MKKSSVDYTKKEIYIIMFLVFIVVSGLAFFIFTLIGCQTTTSLSVAMIFGLSCILPIDVHWKCKTHYTIKHRILVGACGGVLIGGLLLFLVPGIMFGSGVTLEQYNSIQEGMKYKEVKEIFQSDGEIMSEVDMGDPSSATYTVTWNGKGQYGANCVLMFQGGKLVSKAQCGLE